MDMREWKRNENVEVLFDELKEHRLKLTCKWDDTLPRCLYIMLNPSTADTNRCDRTLNRCISFAKDNGLGSIVVVNLYSFRTSNPQLLWEAIVQSHPENAENVKQAIDEAETVIAAWGGQVKRKDSFSWVLDHAKKSEKTVHCLGRNKSGTPRHPLYLRQGTNLEKYLY